MFENEIPAKLVIITIILVFALSGVAVFFIKKTKDKK